MIKVTLKEYKKTNWWYYDGEQPIMNGGMGILVDDNDKPIKIILCCINCGDYSIVDIDTLKKEIK